MGRTQLQDAVPMTLGQEFSGYAACVGRGAEDVAEASEQLLELNIGATAIGTGGGDRAVPPRPCGSRLTDSYGARDGPAEYAWNAVKEWCPVRLRQAKDDP